MMTGRGENDKERAGMIAAALNPNQLIRGLSNQSPTISNQTPTQPNRVRRDGPWLCVILRQRRPG
jgi:hypothetical protein